MTRVTGVDVLSDDGRARLIQAVFSCDECKHLSIGFAGQAQELNGSYRDGNQFIESAPKIAWQPKHASSKEFPDVPAHIVEPASEAYECRSIGANRGAILLARAVIEATAKEKGITTGVLAAKIDQLCAQGFIRAHIKEAAHEARHLGNDMAHGDFGDPVDDDGADEVLVIMDEVLAEVFQSPARTQRLRDKRQAKKTAAGS
jgi:hypothetical protein